MEQLILALMGKLEAAGFSAVRANSAARLPRILQPVVAVGMKQASAVSGGFYDYLGVLDDPETGLRELYGRRVDCAVLLEAICPAHTGAQAAEQTAAGVLQAVSSGVEGVRVGRVTVADARYDGANAVFRCAVTAELSAYFYAVADDDGERFTDFILKGDWT